MGPTQPPIQWVPGILSLGVEMLGPEADHPHLPSSELKNAWSYTSTPLIRLRGVVLSEKHGDFTLTCNQQMMTDSKDGGI